MKQILEETFPNERFKVKSVREGASIEGADIEIVEFKVTQGKEKLWIEVEIHTKREQPPKSQNGTLAGEKSRGREG